MDAQETNNSTIATVISAILSIGSFLHSHATQSNISWVVGLLAAGVAMGAGVMSIRTNYYETKEIKNRLKKK